MEIIIVSSIDELLFYQTEWESILKENNNHILFLELDWIKCWWKYFGDKHQMLVLMIIKGREIIGICPLMLTKKGVCNEINFISVKQSCEMDFILKDEYREEAIECICNFLMNLKGKNIIILHGMYENAENYILLKKYLKDNKAPFTTRSIASYYINLEDSDFNTYFVNRFGKGTRSKIKNKEKKLNSLGNLYYKKISSPQIDEAFEIHEKRWLRKVGNSSFSKGTTKEFYKGLALNKNMKFNIEVDAITLNYRVISFVYGIKYNDEILLYRIAHDDDFDFLSPGALVLRKKVEECFFSKIKVLDLGPGYEPFKADWTDGHEEVYTIIMPSANLQSTLIFYIKYLIKIKLINALKKNKNIINFKKYCLGKVKFSLSMENILGKILKVKRAVSQYGLLTFITKLFTDLAAKTYCYKQYLILETNLKNVEVNENNMQVKEATIDDLSALSEVMNESPRNIIKRFINEHKCYIILHNNEIIHYCWINCSCIEISNVKLETTFGCFDAYIYDIFMLKKLKNEYNYTRILSSILNILYKENFRKCYIMINCSNKSFENRLYRKVFNPRYKIIEKGLFGKIKYSIFDIKLSQNG